MLPLNSGLNRIYVFTKNEPPRLELSRGGVGLTEWVGVFGRTRDTLSAPLIRGYTSVPDESHVPSPVADGSRVETREPYRSKLRAA